MNITVPDMDEYLNNYTLLFVKFIGKFYGSTGSLSSDKYTSEDAFILSEYVLNLTDNDLSTGIPIVISTVAAGIYGWTGAGGDPYVTAINDEIFLKKTDGSYIFYGSKFYKNKTNDGLYIYGIK